MCVLRETCLKFQKGTTGRERVYKSHRNSALKAKLCSAVTLPNKTTAKIVRDSCENPEPKRREKKRLPEILDIRDDSSRIHLRKIGPWEILKYEYRYRK